MFLHLDHIQNPAIRPSDMLLKDHFMQGLLRHFRGAGQADDLEDAFDPSNCGLDIVSSLSHPATSAGKESMELYLHEALWDHQQRVPST